MSNQLVVLETIYTHGMGYDPEATKAKFLDAAFAEFVEHGLAGARVDRISAAAGANKQAIYAYFGSKEGLFEAVITERLGLLLTAVPMTADDLPGYAGAMFDYLLENPGYMRLLLWKLLERSDASTDEVDAYRNKLQQIELALHLDNEKWSAIDVLLLVLSAAEAWAMSAPAIRDLDPNAGDEADRRVRHRGALVAAVAATVDALT
jgi:AcrR family transcriptional regulator